ncbi:MAG: carboxynorspermidine decarboxylase [Kiritimatiellae bacterium]|nr:carboxynorspermidine decarboxylase [Kiritimatiellia bacterium]
MEAGTIETPMFVVDVQRIRRNLERLTEVKRRTGCRILLAQKGFALWRLYPLIREHLDGVCASSPNEARLGREEFNREVHVFAAAYSEADVRALVQWVDEIDFNSFAQWKQFRALVESAGRPIRCGLRINPECSTQDHAIYDPCAPHSRLGIRRAGFEGESLEGISGLHFHTLCEQNADALERTLGAVEERFGDLIPGMSWFNFGGGHHITRADYDVDLLCRLLSDFQQRYGVQVYLEPGEAVALNAGILAATVLDVVRNETDIAILDVSCTAHMPDVLEMPYRPNVCRMTDDLFPPPEARAGEAGEKAHTHRLAGLSCLAGDVIGDYSFDEPLRAGDRLIFEDMAHYSMVKTTMFNGVQHPAIALYDSDTGTDQLEVVRRFTYEDFKHRLA